jgi:hypothetical protein
MNIQFKAFERVWHQIWIICELRPATPLTMKIITFWDMTACSLVHLCRGLGELLGKLYQIARRRTLYLLIVFVTKFMTKFSKIRYRLGVCLFPCPSAYLVSEITEHVVLRVYSRPSICRPCEILFHTNQLYWAKTVQSVNRWLDVWRLKNSGLIPGECKRFFFHRVQAGSGPTSRRV